MHGCVENHQMFTDQDSEQSMLLWTSISIMNVLKDKAFFSTVEVFQTKMY